MVSNIDEKNPAFKLPLVTDAVGLVLYLGLRAGKCSSFTFILISNTISVAERRIYLCRFSTLLGLVSCEVL